MGPSLQRVLVIGCSGAGKSHFARKLATITHLPLYHLDLLWHLPDRATVSPEEFDRKLAEILQRDKWILDGNFQRTLAKRLEYCDTVFLFDLPLADCLKGAEERIGKKRPDLPWLETEFDPEFRQWIIDFQKDRLPGILALLARSPARQIIFRSRHEADAFLAELQRKLSQLNPQNR